MSILGDLIFKPRNIQTLLSLLWILVLTVFTINASAQSGVCNTSEPFCTDDIMVFPAGVNTGSAEAGPDYGCLGSQPNPAWYHMLIAASGDLIIEMVSSPAEDIDFICWGPFPDPHTPCSGQLTSSKIVDCSYAGGTDPEICNISNSQIGEYYLLLITNYSNDPCSITFSKTGGTGETDCNIVPGASSNNGPICEGDDLELYAEPINNATYFWTGPSGFTSNIQNPVIPNAQLSNSGIYNLVVTLGGNSSNPYPTEVIINALPTVSFSATTVCSGESTIFTDLSTCSTSNTPIISWFWDFGDGNTSILQNPSYTYPSSDDIIYNVKLIIGTSAGCVDSTTQAVQILGKPVAGFTYDYTNNIPCLGADVQFNNTSTTNDGVIESFDWDFGDGNTSDDENPIHTYGLPGTYTVILNVVNTGGCDSIIQQDVVINPLPIIDFSYTEVCFGQTSQFYDTNFINVDATDIWLYDFDDGSTSDQSNPEHLYSEAGDYFVSFSIIDTNGCSNSISHMVEVFVSPIAQFSFDTACQFLPTHFSDESAPITAIDYWSWDFGDSESSLLQNPEHIYDTSGHYNVSLIISNENSCNDTISHEVWVWQPPVAHFLHSDTSCTTGLVFFNDSSYSYESNITNYNWGFPDGHASYEQNTYFVFLNTEIYYPVSLEITDVRGCKDTVVESIYIQPGLQMSFNADTVCFGDKTTLSAYIVKPQDDSIAQYTWYFNDGGPQITTPNQSVEYEFLYPGVFEVKLQATNMHNCQHTVRKNVKIRHNPISNYSVQESYCNDSTIFTDSSTILEGSIIYWKWEYGDGQSFEVNSPNNPDHYYFYSPIYNTYESSLITADEFGCRDTAYKDLIHYPCVLVEFYNDTSWICENTSAVFIDSTIIDSDFSISEKTWFFGDGNSISVPPETDTVRYQYQNHGFYDAKLVVAYEGDDLHFEDSITNSVRILASPKPNFSTTSVCLNELTEFTNLSYINEDVLQQVYWNYGDGKDTSYLYQPQNTSHTHEYKHDGDFPISLYLTADNNCSDSIKKSAIVYPLPEMGFIADSTIFCGNANIYFTDTSQINSGNIANRLWTFGDGDFLSVSEDTTSHHYQQGVYSVGLENTSDHYCKSSILFEDYILINPIIEADFEIDPEAVSIHGISNLEISNYTDEETYFRWALSDTIIWENVYSPNVADSIFDTGTYKLKMYTINEFGCTDSISQFFKVTPVYSFYVPTAFSPNGNGINDTFGPAGKYFDMQSYSFIVFNRWGEMVFETNDFYEHWDGKTNKGEIAPVSTYAWMIRLVDMDGNNKVLRGAVSLLL